MRTCPRCGGPQLDVRGCAFNARALEAEGTCFVFDVIFCLPEARPRHGQPLVAGETFTCHRHLLPQWAY